MVAFNDNDEPAHCQACEESIARIEMLGDQLGEVLDGHRLDEILGVLSYILLDAIKEQELGSNPKVELLLTLLTEFNEEMTRHIIEGNHHGSK